MPQLDLSFWLTNLIMCWTFVSFMFLYLTQQKITTDINSKIKTPSNKPHSNWKW